MLITLFKNICLLLFLFVCNFFLCYRLQIQYNKYFKKQIFKQFFFLFRMNINYKKSLVFFWWLKKSSYICSSY